MDCLNVPLHANLKFTVENSTNGKLPFLDVDVTIDRDGVHTGVYRKPTHTGVFLNFKAIVPYKWKFGLIHCLIHRAYKICSSSLYFDAELSKLRSMFASYGYPRAFFDRVLTKFRETMEITSVDRVKEVKTYVYTIKIPFIGSPTTYLKKEVSKSFKEKFGVDINVAYQSCKVGDFFTLKAKTPSILAANVVYKFSCPGDPGTSYIGKTERHFATRMDEHLDRRVEKSAVTKHINGCTSCATNGVSYDNFIVY